MNKIGFIGAGNMASSMIGGLLESGYDKTLIFAADPNAKQDVIDSGIAILESNDELVSQVDVVVLAVKPQILKTVCQQISASVQTTNPLIISVAAGIRIVSIRNWLNSSSPIIRVMPNTPALIGMGMSGLYANEACSDQHRQQAEEIISTTGELVWLDTEKQIDAVTAISGSGPAYFFLFIEEMIKAGESLGLSREVATKLSLQTALGAAQMASKSSDTPEQLRINVTSPGGTTEQAIKTFIEGDLSGLIHSAVKAAENHSEELSRELGETA